MEAEEAIEVKDLTLQDGDGGPHGVVVGLAVRDNDVEAVHGAALEDDNQAMTGEGRGLRQDRAREEAGDGCRACHGEGAMAEEESPVELLRGVTSTKAADYCLRELAG
jgi:hypothetical protein